MNNLAHQPIPETLKMLPTTPQVRGLHTFIRNKDTPRDEFIFYSKRLIRLVIEYTLSLMSFVEKVVETPQGVYYHGKYIASIIQQVLNHIYLQVKPWQRRKFAVCPYCERERPWSKRSPMFARTFA